MKNIFEKRINIILISAIAALCIAIGIPLAVQGIGQSSTQAETEPTTAAVTQAVTEPVTETETTEPPTEVEVETKVVSVKKTSKTSSKASAKTKASTKKATQPTTASETTEPLKFATAPPVENKASYDAQWNAGYLVAIDNPDTSYSSVHIELSDKNRDLLERICMGEYGSGGFTGAAMIAQAIRDDMVTYGIYDVATIISQLHYTGRTDIPATQTVKDAVVYIFDMDKSAIQHRILYMYNPTMMASGISNFHESQRYVCNYGDVRFFDR